MISESEVEKIIKVAINDEIQAIQMSNILIQRIVNAQQGAAPDGNSAALHCRR